MEPAFVRAEAVVLRAHGGPEVLSHETIDVLAPGPGEVRVRVRAVALNHMDIWVRKGGPAFKLSYPHRLGCDIAGEVESIGPGVTDVDVGTKCVLNPGLSCGRCVACLSGHDNLCRQYKILGENTNGGYGALLSVPRQNLAPFPGELSFTDAAAVPLTFLTAWQMLVHKGRVQPGDVVLVQGAGSGVGVAAIQIARLFGATVIATASTETKLEKARALGAAHAIDYTKEDFVAVTKTLTQKRGADIVIEHVGGETFGKSILAARAGGRVVTCGATAGFAASIDLRHVFFRQIELLGSTMGSKADLLAVLPHVASGKLRPVVDRVLKLSEAREAHRALEAREVFGKIVLTPEA